MTNLKIEEVKCLKIELNNNFYLQGDIYSNYYEWFICNHKYSVKLFLFGISKDFDIIKYVKSNYWDIIESYISYLDLNDDEIDEAFNES